ncbi:MAG: succinylglutamate desuccinylase/aspartoacylase family protein [Methanobacteriaceae archaeon]|nr:succinylglutamate desuccinylase/aspartoacylase family protein [Methanobacteriaceae archaeon]
MAFAQTKEDISGKISLISTQARGDIDDNDVIKNNVPYGISSKILLKIAKKGTPLVKLGNGNLKVMLVAGIHGNELPPQIGLLKLVERLRNSKLNGTVYIIPFAAPLATRNNSRWLDGLDLNRAGLNEGSVTYDLLKSIQELEVDAVADFHSTKIGSNPGRESVFCTKSPCGESFEIGQFITKRTSSELICYNAAGKMYKGALEDECNIRGIPAVTCEVVSENGEVTPGSTQKSLMQMESYLKYFKIID